MAAPDLNGKVQGLLKSGYLDWPRAKFYLVRLKSQALGREWLRELLPCITWIGDNDPSTDCWNVALSYNGIKKLTGASALRFPEPFSEGMDYHPRARVLGDVGESDPREWCWGHEGEDSRHDALLLHYMPLDGHSDEARKFIESDAVANVHPLPWSVRLSDSKEHFGFGDGTSQPVIDGLQSARSRAFGLEDSARLPRGELLLGYRNGLNVVEPLPLVDGREFGANGSYLVLRQLEQRVEDFWGWARSQTANDEEALEFASRMVGGRPDGHPLISGNSFADADPWGVRCPLGAHVRRSNPRDSLATDPGCPTSRAEARQAADLHRIVRRARSYGAPAPGAVFPKGVGPVLRETNGQDDVADQEGRGLLFICLNADLVRQFEFIQATWLQNPKFHQLHDDLDPVLGNPQVLGGKRSITIPGEHLARHHSCDKLFVRTRGGAYFFMPGSDDLRTLIGVP